jgi:D-alanyl-D-alanine carboxypeptidase (penicillin-binding protein 5/6)
MGAGVPCSAAVTYSVDGRTQTTRPLPAPASRVGGAALAEAGLHVSPSARLAPPSPKASAWLVADLGTGQVLAACNAHVPLAPASSLKVLTALALMPRIDPAAHYIARNEDARIDGTRVGLVPGSVYTVDNLWHALLMSSANDAAVALSSLAGGLPAATESMRATARSLGAADTIPDNTSGLDAPGQVSSAYDLALFGRAVLADPRLTALVQTRNYAFPEAGTALPGVRNATGVVARKTFQIQNHDRLLYNYPGALGVKNGWTSTTGGSFVAAAQRGPRRVIVTMLAADPQTWHISAALLDWAFTATPASADGVGRLVDGPDPSGALPSAGSAMAPVPGVEPARSGAAGGSRLPVGVAATGAVIAVLLIAVALARRRRRPETSQGRHR